MIDYPQINPVLLSIGPLKIRWYGLMYVIGFTASYLLVLRQARRFTWQAMLDHVDDLNLVLILGVILGGRLGYVAIYNPLYYIDHPLEITAIWSGGMSFHGACLGALFAGWLFCRRKGLNFWKAADLYVVTVPVGLFFGRLGNFINGELYGRISSVPWAMVFPEGGPLPRHPSQLYEAVGEGLLLFIILWSLKSRPWQRQGGVNWPHGTMLALFLGLYGVFRFVVEFARQPDPQIGLLLGWMSMGQVLCALMMAAGLGLWLALRTMSAGGEAAG